MAIKLVDLKWVDLSHDLALEFKTMKVTPREREMNPLRIEKYKRLHSQGKFFWHWCHWIKVKCAEDGLVYRVNGQHGSDFLFGLFEEGQKPVGKVAVERWTADTLDDVIDLYCMLDSNKGVRSLRDMIQAVSGNVDGIESLGGAWLTTITAGVTLALRITKELPFRPETEVKALLPRMYADFYRFFAEDLGVRCNKGKYTRSAIIAVAFQIWRASPSLAFEFWRPFLNNQEEMGPTRRLLEQEIMQSVNSKTETENLYCKCVVAFNAWKRGHDLKLIRIPKDKIPALNLDLTKAGLIESQETDF